MAAGECSRDSSHDTAPEGENVRKPLYMLVTLCKALSCDPLPPVQSNGCYFWNFQKVKINAQTLLTKVPPLPHSDIDIKQILLGISYSILPSPSLPPSPLHVSSSLSSIYLNIFFIIIHSGAEVRYMPQNVYGGQRTNFKSQLVLSSHHVGSKDQIHLVGVHSRCTS